MKTFVSFLVAGAFVATKGVHAGNNKCSTEGPVVSVKNGSYVGNYSSTYHQDFFLGIPFAQPPTGMQRFEPALSVNSSWEGVRRAKDYGPACVGYGSDLFNTPTSEDCLTLNVVRPHGKSHDKLPVAVWLYGGGFFTGRSSAPGYNLSRIVQGSVQAEQPVIAVSLNYRLSAFGWLWSEDVKKNHGTPNVGFLDQRLALRWIRENIESFGGDPDKVVIFGESAGGQSVGWHLIAYGGRDDRLFRGAIMESGSVLQRWPLWVSDPPAYQEESYNNLTDATGCTNATSPYQCLKELPFKKLNTALNITNNWMAGTGLGPFIGVYDGDIIQDFPSKLVQEGRFVKVPIMYGTNTDEGTVSGKSGINTDQDFRSVLAQAGINETTAAFYEALYPNIDGIGIPATFNPTAIPQNQSSLEYVNITTLGRQWKRVSAFYGDVSQHTPRRAMVQSWSQHGQTSYSYRFDITPAQNPTYTGATHAVEVPFVFNNADGWGFSVNPFGTQEDPRHQAYLDASTLMSRMWISFLNNLDPNKHGLSHQPQWPTYNSTSSGIGKNFVFATTEAGQSFSPYIEQDNWRVPNIEFIRAHAVDHWYR